ncbi:hypothetical protein J2Z49_001307 [Desulfofundulus luciae]|uniref:Transposase n=1 Tax=Desulfofundulus luciae TaxID=74702 RepID=A0ABU0B1R4_9FIRM|nr:hypothetical protein [Desulfofundulus luciae]
MHPGVVRRTADECPCPGRAGRHSFAGLRSVFAAVDEEYLRSEEMCRPASKSRLTWGAAIDRLSPLIHH